MRKAASSVTVLFALFLAASTLMGQVATGVYPYGTYDKPGIDTINVGNLNVHLSIPVLNKAGRGLPFQANLIYDSSVYYPVNWGWASGWTPMPNFGWGSSSGLLSGQILYNTTATVETYNDEIDEWEFTINCHYTQYGPFIYIDATGVQHVTSAYTTALGYQDVYPPDGWTCPDDSTPTASGGALDGSGYQVQVSSYTTATVTAPNGAASVNPGGTSTITDTNGNQLETDVSGSYTNYKDTTGNVVLAVTGSMTSSQYYTYYDTGGTARHVTVNYSPYTVETNFGCSGITEYGPWSQYLVGSISFPDSGDTYSFSYEGTPGVSGHVTGRLSGIQLPQGGSIGYSYTGSHNGIECADGSAAGLTRSIASSAGSAASSLTYTRPTSGQTTVVDGLSNNKVYTFVAASNGLPTQYYESTRNVYQGAATGTPLLSRTTCYNCGSGLTSPVTNTAPTPYLPITAIDTFNAYNGGQIDGSTVQYNSSSGTQAQSEVYDFGGSGSRGSLLRQDQWSWGSPFPGDLSEHAVYDGSSNLIGDTGYGYDGSTPTTSSGVPQHVSVSGARGNLTSLVQYASASTSYTTNMTYEDTGSLLTSTFAPASAATTQTYDSTFVYLTGTQLPTVPSSVTLTTGASYDTTYTGLPHTVSDANSQTTTVSSYDSMLRPTEIDLPDYGKTTFSYTPTTTTANTYQTSSVYGTTETQLDGYGRQSRAVAANGQGGSYPWYQQDTCYDANGNVSFVSYAYQGAGLSGSKVCSGAGTTYAYDALGRVTSVTQSNSETRTYTYNGRATKSIDENGVTRISQIDGMGRPTIVCEISSNSSMPGSSGSPASCGTDISGTGFTTTYSYNMATGTTTVTQGAQTRTFQKDWLGRTTSVTEPESGTTTYSYAYNSTGLAVTRTRLRANQTGSTTTTTTTQYDALSRPVSITYNDGTPTKTFAYDSATGVSTGTGAEFTDLTQTNLKGRLSLASISGSPGTAYSYDPMGRTKALDECLPSLCGTVGDNHQLQYTYDYVGNLLTSTDGAGVQSTYTVSLANEVLSITSSQNDSTDPGSLVSSVQNSPNGPQVWSLGNGLTSTDYYDSLGRLNAGFTCIGSTATWCTGGTGRYGWSVAWSGAEAYSPCDSIINACYNTSYDEFGRLASWGGTWGSTTQGFAYVYDRWGNRWQQNVTAGSGPAPSLSFNTSTNRISTSGYSYDAAGNLTNDSYHTYTYDAEGNLTQVDSGSTAQYTYNALNQRVQTVTGAGTTDFVFNANGQRDSEWTGSNAQIAGHYYWGAQPVAFYSGGQTHFQHQDWLGTERMRTTYNGGYEGGYPSLPFGEGYSAWGSDNDSYHYAMLDHDSESDTDHAQFRQYSNEQGRWHSPDPYSGSYDLSNPQSMNRYAYAGNNPLAAIDPKGLEWQFNIGTDCWDWTYNTGTVQNPTVNVVETTDCYNYETWTPDNATGGVSGGDIGGGGGGGGALPSSAPDNGPQYTTQDVCASSALFNKGGDVLLDAVGMIPIGGNVVKAIQAGAGAISVLKAVFSPDSTPKSAASAATGAGITLVDYFKVIAKNPAVALTDGFVKHGAEAVPIAGYIVSAAATVDDIYGKDGMVDYYNDCMAELTGHH